ncbi:MAG: hypothetical protein RAO92_02335, partial [Candidatus Euphemobacter frigidus]|nr:hypothetical protein [Candidatus Euphemobacter frigidus]
DVDFSSQYIWRGLELNRQAVFQPAIRLGDKGLEIEALGNMDLTSSNENRGKFTRWIYRAGLARRTQEGEVAFSYFYYDNQYIGYPKTQEIGLEARWGYPMFAGGNVYWDFDNANGFYFNSSIGYIGDIGPLRIIPKLAIGYATSHYQDFYFGVKETSFLDVEASLRIELNAVGPLFIYAEGLYYELSKSGLRHREEHIRRGENFWAQGGVSLRF